MSERAPWNSEQDASGVPLTGLVAYLTAFGLLLAIYFFVVFCVARGLLGGVGFTLSVMAQCIAASVVMAGFIVWLAPLADVLELWYLHRRPARRRLRGLCPSCGHAHADDPAANDRCPECGTDRALLPPWQFGLATLRRFGIVCGIAFVIGCGAGAAWTRFDERRFLRECAEQRGLAYERHRAWPAEFSTMHFDGENVSSVSVIESPIDPTWKPARRPSG